MNTHNSTQEVKPSFDLFSIIILLTLRFLAVYSFQWIILSKINYQPFTMFETVLVYTGLYSLTTINK